MPPAYEVLLLNTAIPQIQAAQSGDTYVVPRAIAFNAGVNVVNNDVTIYGVTVGRGAGAVSTNTAVGASALSNNIAGAQNTAVGYQAGLVITSGDKNTAFGASIMDQSAGVTGQENAAFGRVNMRFLTSGSYNTALGNESLLKLSTGSNNTAVGFDALLENTTASNNTAVGYNAGRSETTGGSNTFLGLNAGYTQNGGGANTFIGRDAGLSVTTGSYNTFVGAWNGSGNGSGSAVTTGSKNTILGGYTGNQGGLDIRTLSNYLVLSDGDGNPRIYHNGTTVVIPSLPTSSAGLPSGGLWNDSGTLKVA